MIFYALAVRRCYTLLTLIMLAHNVNSTSFNFSSFQPNLETVFYQGDAFSASGVIQVTKNQQNVALTNSVGRASCSEAVHIWDAKTGKIADFTTHFSFVVDALNSTRYGDGLSFFLAPFESEIPDNSFGGYLGLFNMSNSNSVGNHIVAVEFDTRKDGWDPSDNHVGINVNSIVSVATVDWKSSMKNGSTANAWISYNSSTKNLSVFLTYADNPVFGGNSSLFHVVDLSKVLPERVRVGFSAATGDWIEIHNVLSWSFSSDLKMYEEGNRKTLIFGLALSIGLLSLGAGVYWFVWWWKKVIKRPKDLARDFSMDADFENGTGPKRFMFRELKQATNNFDEEGKLGEGGFGGVYKGILNNPSLEVAVKRISSGSKQGKKEYASEVRIISRLRHRNLVQLIGWCHEQNDFLLVYEYMPNGSLDTHLFGGVNKLTWTMRYKIALGLASALLYLHEEWEQCVVHRDIKSSNVMLDANYNAKLGDFGLARLVDHELGSQTTVLAGTLGYLAPECVSTGKASKESDVYSFGVVALEIACGRKPVEAKAEPSRIRLVDWVWELYGRGKVLEASDKALVAEFDEQEMERLMVVGLWCCYPDHTVRPSIKQVINVLNFEAPLPRLPSKLPVPMYFAPPMDMCRFTYTSSAGVTDSDKDQNRTQTTSSSSGSTSAGSSKALLQLRKGGV